MPNVSRFFPLLDYTNVLKIRQMPVGDIYLSGLILRNAYNSIRPGQSSQYFNLSPPTFEEWIAQGPSARPHVVPVLEIM